MKPLVSIVMPVYNVELYLKEALDSLVCQNYRNIELICVDDGSTDSSLQILNEYADQDRRIRIIHQKNLYAGVARNNGLKEAKGKYIMFLDSDDVFEKDMISTLVNKAEKKQTDIIFFGFTHFSNTVKERSLMGIPYHSNKVCSPEEHQSDLFRIAQGVPWNKFFRRDFVIGTGLHFQALQSNNDVFFSKMIVTEARRILFLNRRFVNYRISNVDSLQGSYKLASGNFAKCITAIYHELHKREKYDLYKDTFKRYVLESYMLIFDKIRDYDNFFRVCAIMRESLLEMEISSTDDILSENDTGELFRSIIEEKYNNSLFLLNEYRRQYSAPKTGIEYRIGKTILKHLKVKMYN